MRSPTGWLMSFMVISYDRRGNSRSPVPDNWQTTSPEEQADDAAALLNALGTGPAAVFGTSGGGTFALCLMIRHPASVRGAILHEPMLYALVDNIDAVPAPVRASIQKALEVGGPPAAVEPFWRYVAGGDGWARLAPALRERLRTPPVHCSGSSLGPTSSTCPTMRRWQPSPSRCACSSARTSFRSSPRWPVVSASVLASMSSPCQARTRHITSTLTNSRKQYARFSVRSVGSNSRTPALARHDRPFLADKASGTGERREPSPERDPPTSSDTVNTLSPSSWSAT